MGGGVVNMLSVVVRIMYSVVVRTPLNNRHEWDTSRLPAHSRWRGGGVVNMYGIVVRTPLNNRHPEVNSGQHEWDTSHS